VIFNEAADKKIKQKADKVKTDGENEEQLWSLK
jgi:hypothetical protein